jgi:hypothetical protein
VSALLAIGALLVTLASIGSGDGRPGAALASALDWEPGRSWPEVWRPWTSAWVHWSPAHLLVNLLGAAVVAGLGWRARASNRAALAWLLAWPLTQALLALPAAVPGHGPHAALPMAHYGGLSGVLHAGVMVIGLALALPRSLASPGAAADGLAPLTPGQLARHRLVGLGLVAGTLAKVLLEAPWDLALRPSALLGIEVAPLAHACGVAAGALAWGVVAMAGGRASNAGSGLKT